MIRFYVDFLQAEGRCQEEEEEKLHHPEEDQAQAQEGEAGGVEVLQGRRQREDQSAPEGVPCGGVRRWSFHGRPL